MLFPSHFAIPSNTTLNPQNDETWYVSYLPFSDDYGSNTTALVVGQMQRFFILDGDFRKEYQNLMPQGFRACYQFFLDNLDKRNKRSVDEPVPVEELETIMSTYSDFLDRTRAKNFRVRKCKDGGYWLQERAIPSQSNGLAWLNKSKHPQVIDVLSVLKTSRKLSDKSIALIEEEFRNA